MKAIFTLLMKSGGILFLSFFIPYLLKTIPPLLGGMTPITVPWWSIPLGFFGMLLAGEFLIYRVLRPMMIWLVLMPVVYFHLEFLADALKIHQTMEIKWIMRGLALSLSVTIMVWGFKFLRWLAWKILWTLFWPVRALRSFLEPRLKRLYYKIRGIPPCPINLSLEEIDALGQGDTYEKGKQFEEFIARVYQTLGHDALTTGQLRERGLLPPSIQVRGGSGEQGVDVVVPVQENGEDKKILVQCKHYSKKVDNSAVQEIVSALPLYGGHQAVVITNNYFTKPAMELAAANGVLLIDRPVLKKLISNAVKKYEADKKAA